MIQRDVYLNRIIPLVDKPVIKIITGMRRSGKSTLLALFRNWLERSHRVSSKKIIFIDKESLQFENIRDYKDLNQYVLDRTEKKQEKYYLIVDEVQLIKDWEKAILSFHNQKNLDIYISGSNASLLSSELATLLSGRHVEISVYPLSFKEFLKFRGVTDETEFKKEFANFTKFGGLPGIHELIWSESVIFQYINAIINTVLLKDVVQRHQIRNIAHLESITRFVCDNTGQIISAKKISDYFKSQKMKVSVDTVINYLSYLSDAFFAFKVPRYDLKGKRHLEINEKYYIGDIGLRNGFIGHRGDDISGILENVIYLELKKRNYSVSIGKQDLREVDFIARKEGKTEYYQVSYLLASNDTVEREFSPLLSIEDNYPKYVLSLDDFVRENQKGIQHLNIIDFLLKT